MENPDIREFRSEQLHVIMKEKPGCLVRLDVTASAPSVAAAYETAHKNVKKEVAIPGFRKGKAPDEVIRNNFRDIVDKEARNILRSVAFKEALALCDKTPFGEHALRKADLKRASMEEGASLVFEFEAQPEIPDIDPKHLHVKKVDQKPVDPSQLEKLFTQILEKHATFTPITDRPAAIDDYVKVDVDVIDSPAHNLVSDRRICIRKGSCADWLYDAVIGMQSDEAKEVQAPEEKPDGTSAMRNCRVFVKEISSCTMPTETPELLKELNAESFQALKERLHKRFEVEAYEACQDEMRRNLKNELIRHYAFDLPQSLVQAETAARLQQLKPKTEPALPHEKDKLEEQKREVLEEVKRYFTCMFLLQKAGKQHQFEVSEHEFFDEMMHQMFYVPSEKRVIFDGQEEMTRQRIYMNVMMRKVEDWLLKSIFDRETSGVIEHTADHDHGDHSSCSCPHH